MAHIIINLSLSAAIGYNLFLNPPKFAEVSAILEPAKSMRMDYRRTIPVPVMAVEYSTVLPNVGIRACCRLCHTFMRVCLAGQARHSRAFCCIARVIVFCTK